MAQPQAAISPSADLVVGAQSSAHVVRVAGFWRRSVAAAIDAACIAPAILVLGWLAFRASGLRLPAATDIRVENMLELLLEGGSFVHSLLAMELAIVLLYGFLFTATTGATPGLRLLRLKVINVYGDAPEWWRVLLRCLGFLCGGLLLGLGLLWIGFDREKRGLHDWLAGTYVIRNDPDRMKRG